MQSLARDFIKRSTRLLDVSRVETGNLQLERSPTDISSIVRQIAHNYETSAARGGGSLTVSVQDGVIGLLDPLAVEQVVENLLSNALKFGMGQPVLVQLRSDGQSASLQVQDFGIGMTPEQQARIFARFEQVVTQHKGVGFGIGLWVANRLVTAMGGRIAVSSVIEQGATFTVTFPIAAQISDRTSF